MSKPDTKQSSRHSRSNSRSKIRYRAGKITRNPFLNFLRDFRKHNKGLKITELTKRGAQVWRNMNEREKSPYCSMARQAPVRRVKRASRRRKNKERSRRRHRSRNSLIFINEKQNKIFPYPMDADADMPRSNSPGPKIIELPDVEDDHKGLEIIDLT